MNRFHWWQSRSPTLKLCQQLLENWLFKNEMTSVPIELCTLISLFQHEFMLILMIYFLFIISILHIYLNIILKMYSFSSHKHNWSLCHSRPVSATANMYYVRGRVSLSPICSRQWSPADQIRHHHRSPQWVHFYRRCRSVWWLAIFQKYFHENNHWNILSLAIGYPRTKTDQFLTNPISGSMFAKLINC